MTNTLGCYYQSSAVGAMVNMALFIMGKVPVNLNYTLSQESMQKALAKANINHIITSEKFLNKLKDKGFDFAEVLGDKAIFAENLAKNDRSQYENQCITYRFTDASIVNENSAILQKPRLTIRHDSI